MSEPRLDHPTEFGMVHHLHKSHSDPFAIVGDATMSATEKRATLADWASDARAVRDHPAFRRLDTGVVVDIDSVLGALKRLDGIEDDHSAFRINSPSKNSPTKNRDNRRPLWQFWKDDDDDPPPCPAAAVPWKPRPLPDATSGLMVA